MYTFLVTATHLHVQHNERRKKAGFGQHKVNSADWEHWGHNIRTIKTGMVVQKYEWGVEEGWRGRSHQ